MTVNDKDYAVIRLLEKGRAAIPISLPMESSSM